MVGALGIRSFSLPWSRGIRLDRVGDKKTDFFLRNIGIVRFCLGFGFKVASFFYLAGFSPIFWLLKAKVKFSSIGERYLCLCDHIGTVAVKPRPTSRSAA